MTTITKLFWRLENAEGHASMAGDQNHLRIASFLFKLQSRLLSRLKIS
jgi:hypothetical protein